MFLEVLPISRLDHPSPKTKYSVVRTSNTRVVFVQAIRKSLLFFWPSMGLQANSQLPSNRQADLGPSFTTGLSKSPLQPASLMSPPPCCTTTVMYSLQVLNSTMMLSYIFCLLRLNTENPSCLIYSFQLKKSLTYSLWKTRTQQGDTETATDPNPILNPAESLLSVGILSAIRIQDSRSQPQITLDTDRRLGLFTIKYSTACLWSAADKVNDSAFQIAKSYLNLEDNQTGQVSVQQLMQVRSSGSQPHSLPQVTFSLSAGTVVPSMRQAAKCPKLERQMTSSAKVLTSSSTKGKSSVLQTRMLTLQILYSLSSNSVQQYRVRLSYSPTLVGIGLPCARLVRIAKVIIQQNYYMAAFLKSTRVQVGRVSGVSGKYLEVIDSEYVGLEAKCAHLQLLADEAKKQNQTLLGQIKLLKNQLAALLRVKENYATLQKANQGLSEELTSLRLSLKSAQESAYQKQQQLRRQRIIERQLRGQFQQFSAKLKGSNREKESWVSIESARIFLHQNKVNNQRRVLELQSKLSRLVIEKLQLQTANSFIAKQLQDKKLIGVRHTSQVAQLRTKLDQQAKQLKATSHFQKSLQDLRDQRNAASIKIEQLSNALQGMQGAGDWIKQQKDQLCARVAELEKQALSLSTELKRKSQECSRSQIQIRQLRVLVSQLTGKIEQEEGRISELQSCRAEYLCQVQRLRAGVGRCLLGLGCGGQA